jgi:D-alanyl-D-alanine endopeptidase (penicillin-binding protein 7)
MPLETGRDLGLTLIHFLWQGLLLAALLNTILPICRSAIARHNCALATLAMMALAPALTFLSIHGFGKNGGAALAENAAAGPLPSAAIFAPGMNWLVILWLAGIAVLSLRALGGWYLVQSLGRLDTLAVPPDLLQRYHELQRRLAVAWPVHFLLSRRIDVPMVIGWLRPVILIPVSAIAGLAPHQLDALILHELAHIRRLDTVTNILLVAVETVLFYHPAVWWVSRRVRIEREHCCDDFAVSACGDAAMYVEALTSLETWKSTASLALAANGGRLKDRVARLLDAPVQSPRFSLSAVTGLALLGLVAASVAMAAPSSRGKDLGATDIRPIQETHTLPPYPKESIHLKEQGRVTLAVTIGTDGAVSHALVVKPSGHQRLDVAAAQFVKSHWRWQPATRAGKPVITNTRVSVLFKLGPKPAAPATP